MSLERFSRRISARSDRIGRNVNTTVRRVALAADQAVVLGTPVDTGRARSNWRVSLNNPLSDTIDAFAPGERLGIGEQANAAGAIAQGATVIGTRREGQDIWISNNVPYIGLLNDGSSAQAPANFVEAAAMEAAAVVRNARVVDGN